MISTYWFELIYYLNGVNQIKIQNLFFLFNNKFWNNSHIIIVVFNVAIVMNSQLKLQFAFNRRSSYWILLVLNSIFIRFFRIDCVSLFLKRKFAIQLSHRFFHHNTQTLTCVNLHLTNFYQNLNFWSNKHPFKSFNAMIFYLANSVY